MTAAALLVGWYLADPPPGDGWRIPPIPHLRAGLDFNRRHRTRLEWRLAWEPYPARRAELRAALAEAEELHRLWDALWGARPDYDCTPEQRRCYLRTARLMLGRDAYRRMDLPPCVPTWRFHELR